MKQRYSKKYSQGYGTMLVALIGAAGVAGSIGYEARLQGQTGERNESLKGYLQARELASERIMMMLAELEKAGPTAVALQGVNANTADVAIQNVSPKSIADLATQSGVNFNSMEEKMRQEVEASSGWRNASLSLDTQMIGASPRVIRDANSIPVSLEYTMRVKGKGYYFCPSAGSQTGCATGKPPLISAGRCLCKWRLCLLHRHRLHPPVLRIRVQRMPHKMWTQTPLLQFPGQLPPAAAL